jgi:hypothetical protein
MTSPIRIKPTADGYETLHDAWVENGRSSQFSVEGDFGGAIIEVVDTSAEEPDFYQMASLGPTEVDSRGAITEEGWPAMNKDWLYLRMRRRHNGRWEVEAPKRPQGARDAFL